MPNSPTNIANDIPCDYWKSVCADVDHPLSCVDPDNKFVWVNSAFERLVGYSIAELAGRTWMSITDQKDVGGDLASVHSVIEGKIPQYTMSKNYVHKRGHKVPVDLTVRRFPDSPLDPLAYFRVESPPARATRPELEEVKETLMCRIQNLEAQMEREKVSVNVGSEFIGGDKIGRDKNGTSAMKFMAGAFTIMAITIAYLFYYVATTATNTTPEKPSIVNADSPSE